MTSEENTREGRNRRVIDEEVQLPKTGIITEVHEHLETDDVWNFHVDVRIDQENHPRKVPVATAMPDLIAPPRGANHPDGPDLALVQFMADDETQRPIVTHILYNDRDRPPLGKEGEIRLRRGPLFAEMADDGSYARLAKKKTDDDTYAGRVDDVTSAVEIDDKGRTQFRYNSNPDTNDNNEFEVGVDPATGNAFIRGDTNDDGFPDLEVDIDKSAGTVTMKTDNDKNGTFDMKVELDSSAAAINIQNDDGTINIKNQGGTIQIGDESGTFKKVARKGDSVSVSDPESGTLTGSIDSGSSNVEST